MTGIDAKHLIVGAGVLGLAVADHILRRGGEGVVLLESSRAPGSSRHGSTGFLLSTGLPAYRGLEERTLLLLEDWPSYLEIDPIYRRSGSIIYPPGMMDGDELEPLDPANTEERYARLQLPPEAKAAFQPRDGLVDRIALISALHWQVRKRGGHIICNCELRSLRRQGESYHFVADARNGTADHVYLTAGPNNLQFLRELGEDVSYELETWHRFQFESPPGDVALLRLGEKGEAILFDSGQGEIILHLIGPPDPQPREPVLTWGVLESFRKNSSELLPNLNEARVRRGVAENLIGLPADNTTPYRSADGKLLAGGDFGIHGMLLALAVGEQMAEWGLES